MKNSFLKLDPSAFLDANKINSHNKSSNLDFAYKDIKEECSRELSLIKEIDGKFNVLLAFITALVTAFTTVINIYFDQRNHTREVTIAIIAVYIVIGVIYILLGLSLNFIKVFRENEINVSVNKNHDELLVDYINAYIKLYNSAKKLYAIKSIFLLLCIALIGVTLGFSVLSIAL